MPGPNTTYATPAEQQQYIDGIARRITRENIPARPRIYLSLPDEARVTPAIPGWVHKVSNDINKWLPQGTSTFFHYERPAPTTAPANRPPTDDDAKWLRGMRSDEIQNSWFKWWSRNKHRADMLILVCARYRHSDWSWVMSDTQYQEAEYMEAHDLPVMLWVGRWNDAIPLVDCRVEQVIHEGGIARNVLSAPEGWRPEASPTQAVSMRSITQP